MKNLIWITVLIISLIAIIAICLPLAEAYLGIDVPWTEMKPGLFIIYGHKITDYDLQWGIMLGAGLLLMLPARLMHVAIIKLRKN